VNFPADKWPHGTRARYALGGCRCESCRAANAARHHQRREAMAAAAAEVKPSGPPGDGVQLRAGREFRIKTCPGANGAACVKGGAWLKNSTPVCSACLERATIFNGLVDAEPVRQHLMRLRRAGVGYKTVAAACDVGKTAITKILDRSNTFIRAQTARRILAVDAKAKADHAVISSPSTIAKAQRQVEELIALGFRKHEIARLLGSKSPALQVGRTGRLIAKSAAAIERLLRRARAGELKPTSPYEDAAPLYAFLEVCARRGLDQRWLSERLGFHVLLAHPPRRMWKRNADRVRLFMAEVRQQRVEGDGLPDGWQQTAPEFRGEGWGLDRRVSKAGQKREQVELRKLARSA
jgi:hypothetical protein